MKTLEKDEDLRMLDMVRIGVNASAEEYKRYLGKHFPE